MCYLSVGYFSMVCVIFSNSVRVNRIVRELLTLVPVNGEYKGGISNFSFKYSLAN